MDYEDNDEEIYYEHEEDDFIDEEPDYKATFKDFERMGGPNLGLGTLLSEKDMKGNNVKTLFRVIKKNYEMLTNEQLFQYYLSIIIFKLKDDEILVINNETIEELISYIPRLKTPEYINPLGYILGYMATNKGKSIEKYQMLKTMELIPKLKNYSFVDADLIRYSKLWLCIKS